MKEEGKGVGLHKSEEARARVPEGQARRAGPGQCPEKGQGREEVTAAHEGLQEHRKHANTAPDQLREYAVEVCGAGDRGIHLRSPSLSAVVARDVPAPGSAAGGAILPGAAAS